MGEALLEALRERPRFARLTLEDLEPLPATGTAHGHVRLPDGLIARVAYAYEGDAGAAARLATQAAAFRWLAPSACTPILHDVLPPRAGLPGGALIVDRIVGQAPVLPRDLGAMAASLAAIHMLEVPPVSSPIPRQNDPFVETLEVVDQNARRFLDRAVIDTVARAEIDEELDLMRGLRHDTGTAIVLITHDLGVVAEMADEVAVMYAGQIVERAAVADLFARPEHPYTVGLLGSIPRLDERRDRLPSIEGRVPDMTRPPAGCRFAARCPFVEADCRTTAPSLVEVTPGHLTRCRRAPLSGIVT